MRAVRLASEPSEPSPYMTAKEAAAYLRYASAAALYKAIPIAGIPVLRRGHSLLFHRDQLDRWLAGERKVTLMAEARRHGQTIRPTSASPLGEIVSPSKGGR